MLVEVADSNNSSQWTSVPFTKGVPTVTTPPDQAYFTAINLAAP